MEQYGSLSLAPLSLHSHNAYLSFSAFQSSISPFNMVILPTCAYYQGFQLKEFKLGQLKIPINLPSKFVSPVRVVCIRHFNLVHSLLAEST